MQTQEKIVEIISLVLKEIKSNKAISEIDLNELTDKGYSEKEISTAFSWLIDRVEFKDPLNFTEPTDAYRMLHSAERDLFTTEAHGTLIELHSLGVLTNQNIEDLVEKALFTGYLKIDQPKLKQMVAEILLSSEGTIENGSRLLLRGNDTIN